MRTLRSATSAFLITGLILAVTAVVGCRGDAHKHHEHGDAGTGAAAPAQGNPHPGHCPVMGGKVDIAAADKNGDLYTDYEGKRYYYCCEGCKPKFEKDPEKWIASPAKPTGDGHAH